MLSRAKTFAIAGAMVLVGIAHGSLIDATVLVDKSDDDRTLTVRYSGAAVTTVALKVNGTLQTRGVSESTTSGAAEFSINPAALQDGQNEIVIELFNAAGQNVGSQTTVIYVDRSATGPVFISSPEAGTTVRGAVEITIGFERRMSDVYVSFYVNNDFRSMRNSPPYSFLWDTERENNGWHEVYALVVDGAGRTYRTQRQRLFVQNAGGNTIRNERPLDEVVTTPEPEEELLVLSYNEVEGESIGEAAPAKSVESPEGIEAGQQTIAPTGDRTVAKPIEDLDESIQTSANLDEETAEARMPRLEGRGVSEQPKAVAPDAVVEVAEAESVEPVVEAPVETVAEPISVPVIEDVPIAVETEQPIDTNVKLEAETEQLVAMQLPPVADLTAVSIGYGTRLPDIGNYTILLNNSVVNFDVLPRVENGIPLTPFRHLFEHAGGEVGWEHDTKTVLAEGMGRNVWIRIGDDFARIDGSRIRLERTPFIDSGRTIVPLSFIVDSLNVDVDFDEKTGHVLVRPKS